MALTSLLVQTLICATSMHPDRPAIEIQIQEKTVAGLNFITDELQITEGLKPRPMPERIPGTFEYYLGTAFTVDVFLAIDTDHTPALVTLYKHETISDRWAIEALRCR